ncbi:MAG: phosphoribosylformylglycinamidine synthase subunit PurQ [Bdellovibrionales bacterium]
MKKIGVVRFLGTNCDQDIFDAIAGIDGLEPVWLWYEESFDADSIDGVVIPGGFSYGDYLRCGALASKMPVMDSVEAFSKKGGKILGICNGFQVLCERGLLPGVLMRNEKISFIDQWSTLKAVSEDSAWGLKGNYTMPIAHGEGRFYISADGFKGLIENDQIWLKYEDNPNGSVSDIAGVLNKEKNVAGLMPHPERAVAKWMGGDQGKALLEKFL